MIFADRKRVPNRPRSTVMPTSLTDVREADVRISVRVQLVCDI